MTEQPREVVMKDKLTADDAPGWYECESHKSTTRRVHYWDGRGLFECMDSEVTVRDTPGWLSVEIGSRRNFRGPLVPASPPIRETRDRMSTGCTHHGEQSPTGQAGSTPAGRIEQLTGSTALLVRIAALEAELAAAREEAAGAKQPRMFPLQTSRQAPPGPRQIPWSVAEKAYGEYSRQYGRGQTLERLAERGGFGWCEMDALYPAWRDEVSEIVALRQRAEAAEAERDRMKAALLYVRGMNLCWHKGSCLKEIDAALAAEVSPKPASCGFKPPTPGYGTCTREKGHTGPCAHPLASLPGQKMLEL